MGWKESFRHAFAVEKKEDFQPTEEQKKIVDKLCREIVRRHMETPSKLLLEVCQPLNYIGAQALHFLRPAASAIFNTHQYRVFAEFLEHRGAIDYIVSRLEHFENRTEQDEGSPEEESEERKSSQESQ